MKDIILKTLTKLRGRPFSNEYIADQIESDLRTYQNECLFKAAQEHNRNDLAIRAAKQMEAIPQSSIGYR